VTVEALCGADGKRPPLAGRPATRRRSAPVGRDKQRGMVRAEHKQDRLASEAVFHRLVRRAGGDSPIEEPDLVEDADRAPAPIHGAGHSGRGGRVQRLPAPSFLTIEQSIRTRRRRSGTSTKTAVLLRRRLARTEELTNTLKRHRIRFHKGSYAKLDGADNPLGYSGDASG